MGITNFSSKEYADLVFLKIRRMVALDGPEVELNLSGTVFPWPIGFSKCFSDNKYSGVTFDHCVFSDECDFDDISLAQASFLGCIFEGDANFGDVKFRGHATFIRAHFKKVAYFSGSEFTGNVGFTRAIFDDVAWFDKVTFWDAALFRAVYARPNALRLHNIQPESLGRVYFSSFEVGMLSFKSCPDWPVSLSLESGLHGSQKECEELYRAMKQKAAGEHDQPQVSHWHYREKLMAMKRGGDSLFERILLWLYFATSGFGERATQALGVLVALLGVSFLANAWTPPWSWNEVIPLSAAANATLASIPFAKDIPGDGWVKVARGFWQFLIAVQFTLFALAVRNRFRR
jgi:hypothetical protein